MDIIIDENNKGKAIRELLRRDMGYSSGMLKKLKFSPGGILVNGEFVTVRYILQEGDILSIACEDTDDDTSPYITPVDLPLGIAYEDEHVTVIHKPHAMPAHPSLGHRDDTVANALAYRYSDKPYVFRPVNRLDRDTSGLMITANTRLAAFNLYKEMIGGKIKKAYIAVLDGEIDNDRDILEAYMGRCEDSIVKRRICSPLENDAKKAITAYITLHKNKDHSLVLASPITGRTHQLRLHFSSIGHPITGDTMYGNEHSVLKRHALHSAYTSFSHPHNGQLISLFSPVPEDISDIMDNEMRSIVTNEITNYTKQLLLMIKEYEK